MIEYAALTKIIIQQKKGKIKTYFFFFSLIFLDRFCNFTAMEKTGELDGLLWFTKVLGISALDRKQKAERNSPAFFDIFCNCRKRNYSADSSVGISPFTSAAAFFLLIVLMKKITPAKIASVATHIITQASTPPRPMQRPAIK